MQIKQLQSLVNKFLADSGISKNALAKKLGVSQSQVSNLTNGKLKRLTQNTKKIADFIQGYYQDNFKIPVKIEQVLKQILIKNPENEAQVLKVLEAIKELKLDARNGKNKGRNKG